MKNKTLQIALKALQEERMNCANALQIDPKHKAQGTHEWQQQRLKELDAAIAEVEKEMGL